MLQFFRNFIFRVKHYNFFEDVKILKSDEKYVLWWGRKVLSKTGYEFSKFKDIFSDIKNVEFPLEISVTKNEEKMLYNLSLFNIKDRLGNEYTLFPNISKIGVDKSFRIMTKNITISNFTGKYFYRYILDKKSKMLIEFTFESDKTFKFTYYDSITKLNFVKSTIEVEIVYNKVDFETDMKILKYVVSHLDELLKNRNNKKPDAKHIFIGFYNLLRRNQKMCDVLNVTFIENEKIFSKIVCKSFIVEKYVYIEKFEDDKLYLKDIDINMYIQKFIERYGKE